MKRLIRTIMVATMASVLLPVVAQRHFGILDYKKTIPNVYGMESLMMYIYRQVQNDELPRCVLNFDTISTEEMKEMFYNHQDEPPARNIGQCYDTVIGIYGGIMLDKIVQQQSGLKHYRAKWDCTLGPMLLSLQPPGGGIDTITYRRLKKRKGGKDGYVMAGELMPGKTGSVTILRSPLWYMGQTVSAAPVIYYYSEGKRVSSYYGNNYPDYFSYESVHWFGMPPWYRNIQKGMLLFATQLTANSMERLPKSECSFTFLMRIHDNGGYSLELLQPREPDKEVKSAFALLQKLVREDLRPGLFNVLFTADKRIFPGRYISASFGPRGWYLRDLLPVE